MTSWFHVTQIPLCRLAQFPLLTNVWQLPSCYFNVYSVSPFHCLNPSPYPYIYNTKQPLVLVDTQWTLVVHPPISHSPLIPCSPIFPSTRTTLTRCFSMLSSLTPNLLLLLLQHSLPPTRTRITEAFAAALGGNSPLRSETPPGTALGSGSAPSTLQRLLLWLMIKLPSPCAVPLPSSIFHWTRSETHSRISTMPPNMPALPSLLSRETTPCVENSTTRTSSTTTLSTMYLFSKILALITWTNYFPLPTIPPLPDSQFSILSF